MSLLARVFGLMVIFGLTLPLVVAQDKDKDKPDKKADKKADKGDKKGDKGGDKKDDGDPKDTKKKGDKKPPEPEEKVVYGQVIAGKLRKIDNNTSRDFTLEMPVLDQAKVAALAEWQRGQLAHIGNAQNLQQRAERLQQYQIQLPRKSSDIYSPKEFELRGSDQIKVRSNYPPIEYDDRGFMKKWTAKELAALKGNSKLPGYPSALENLRPNQIVQVFLAKTKNAPINPKGPRKDDIPDGDRPEAVMILITQESNVGGN